MRTEHAIALVGLTSLLFGMALAALIYAVTNMLNERHWVHPIRYSGVVVTDSEMKHADKDIAVTMPCGNKYVLMKGQPFPLKNIPCPCGNKNHWLFRRE